CAQLSRVVDSEANRRRSSRGSIRTPPRAVTAENDLLPFVMATGSSGSRMNSAIPPKVPRLHCVAGLLIWASRNSTLFTVTVFPPPLYSLGIHLQAGCLLRSTHGFPHEDGF